jgi:hypothetical protein
MVRPACRGEGGQLHQAGRTKVPGEGARNLFIATKRDAESKERRHARQSVTRWFLNMDAGPPHLVTGILKNPSIRQTDAGGAKSFRALYSPGRSPVAAARARALIARLKS